MRCQFCNEYLGWFGWRPHCFCKARDVYYHSRDEFFASAEYQELARHLLEEHK